MEPRSSQPDKFGWDDERVSAYLDGELSVTERNQLEDELKRNPDLRLLVEELRAVRQQLESLPQHKLPAEFAATVLQRAEQEMLLTSPDGALPGHSPATDGLDISQPAPTSWNGSPARSSSTNFNADQQPRNIRPLIWSAIALAAGLVLLITNTRVSDVSETTVAQHDFAPHDSRKTDFSRVDGRDVDRDARPVIAGKPSAVNGSLLKAASDRRESVNDNKNGVVSDLDAVLKSEGVQNPESRPMAKGSLQTPPASEKMSRNWGVNSAKISGKQIKIAAAVPSVGCYVVSMQCPTAAITNASFERVLQDNQVTIQDGEKLSENRVRFRSRSVGEQSDERLKNAKTEDSKAGLPNSEDAIVDRADKGRMKISKMVKPTDEKNVFEDGVSLGSSSDKAPRTGGKFSDNDFEVVVVEMDRGQFDRVMRDLTNKNEEFSELQIAEASLAESSTENVARRLVEAGRSAEGYGIAPQGSVPFSVQNKIEPSGDSKKLPAPVAGSGSEEKSKESSSSLSFGGIGGRERGTFDQKSAESASPTQNLGNAVPLSKNTNDLRETDSSRPDFYSGEAQRLEFSELNKRNISIQLNRSSGATAADNKGANNSNLQSNEKHKEQHNSLQTENFVDKKSDNATQGDKNQPDADRWNFAKNSSNNIPGSVSAPASSSPAPAQDSFGQTGRTTNNSKAENGPSNDYFQSAPAQGADPSEKNVLPRGAYKDMAPPIPVLRSDNDGKDRAKEKDFHPSQQNEFEQKQGFGKQLQEQVVPSSPQQQAVPLQSPANPQTNAQPLPPGNEQIQTIPQSQMQLQTAPQQQVLQQQMIPPLTERVRAVFIIRKKTGP